MVSGSPRTHYRYRSWRIWRRGAHYRACGNATDSKRRCLEHIRLSRDRLSDRHGCNRISYAESTRWLEARGLDTNSERNFASRGSRLHARRGAQDLAVVGALVALVFSILAQEFQ